LLMKKDGTININGVIINSTASGDHNIKGSVVNVNT